MRRVIGTVVLIFVLLLPILASAQNLFGLGMPWAGGQAPGASGVYSSPWGVCCPSVYVGYEIRQSRDRKPLNFSLDVDSVFNFPIGRFVLGLDIDLQRNINFSDPGGLWLGISNYCQLRDKVGVMVSGWYLFPSSGSNDQTTALDLAITLTPPGITLFDATFAFKTIWNTTRSWGWIDGAMVIGSPCGLNLIAGFRWDSETARLTDPRLVTAIGPVSFGSPREADLTLNSYIPFLGTQYCSGDPCCGLLVRVIGFPWVPGALRYGQTGILGNRLQVNGNYKRGHFLEVFSEYSWKRSEYGCVGLFARWNYLDVRSRGEAQILGGILPGLSETSGAIRTSWTIGGKATLNFNTPFGGGAFF